MVEMAVGLGFLYRDTVLGGSDAGAFHLLEGDGGAHIQGCNGLRNRGLIRPGIGQGADQHIAANSRKCVQITSDRHESSL